MLVVLTSLSNHWNVKKRQNSLLKSGKQSFYYPFTCYNWSLPHTSGALCLADCHFKYEMKPKKNQYSNFRNSHPIIYLVVKTDILSKWRTRYTQVRCMEFDNFLGKAFVETGPRNPDLRFKITTHGHSSGWSCLPIRVRNLRPSPYLGHNCIQYFEQIRMSQTFLVLSSWKGKQEWNATISTTKNPT